MSDRCRYCLNARCVLLNIARADLSFQPEEFTQVLEFERGQTLFQEGASSYGYYFICAGRIKLAKRSLGGKRALLAILGPGDIIGSTPQGRYQLYAEALATSRVGFIDRRDLDQLLARHPKLATALIEKLTGELSRLQERLYTTTQPSARAKVAHLLLELAADFGKASPDGILVDTELSRAELAEMTGLSRETVSLILSEFVAKGLITTQQRSIALCDQARLRDLL